jgi:hypothetical protein
MGVILAGFSANESPLEMDKAFKELKNDAKPVCADCLLRSVAPGAAVAMASPKQTRKATIFIAIKFD